MTVFPVAYFGPIAYYREFVNSNSPIIEVKEHFVKQTIRSRCEVLGPNGKQLLSIPVEKINGNKTSMDELVIVEDGWRKIHWKSIETAYSSAAHFDYYGMEVKELIEAPISNLVEFNRAIHDRVLSWLDFPDFPYECSSEYILNPSKDFRKVKLDTDSEFKHANYYQVFNDRPACLQNLSILDLIFNEGPMARNWMNIP